MLYTKIALQVQDWQLVITALLFVAYAICRNEITVDYDDNTDGKYKIDDWIID